MLLRNNNVKSQLLYLGSTKVVKRGRHGRYNMCATQKVEKLLWYTPLVIEVKRQFFHQLSSQIFTCKNWRNSESMHIFPKKINCDNFKTWLIEKQPPPTETAPPDGTRNIL